MTDNNPFIGKDGTDKNIYMDGKDIYIDKEYTYTVTPEGKIVDGENAYLALNNKWEEFTFTYPEDAERLLAIAAKRASGEATEENDVSYKEGYAYAVSLDGKIYESENNEVTDLDLNAKWEKFKHEHTEEAQRLWDISVRRQG